MENTPPGSVLTAKIEKSADFDPEPCLMGQNPRKKIFLPFKVPARGKPTGPYRQIGFFSPKIGNFPKITILGPNPIFGWKIDFRGQNWPKTLLERLKPGSPQKPAFKAQYAGFIGILGANRGKRKIWPRDLPNSLLRPQFAIPRFGSRPQNPPLRAYRRIWRFYKQKQPKSRPLPKSGKHASWVSFDRENRKISRF